jgi:hypothetical protein
MKSRLTHTSVEAYIRLMQMSRHRLFVFVESETIDPFFYDQVCAVAADLAGGITYQIATGRELPVETGGKPGLLHFYRELEVRGALRYEFQQKKGAVLFFLDKDLDDIVAKQVVSPHVCYTECYDVEGHLFRHGDFRTAAAAATYQDYATLERIYGEPATWIARAAHLWIDWVKLCLFCLIKEIRCECSFGSLSKVNSPWSSPVDPEKLRGAKQDLVLRSGLSEEEFDFEFAQTSRLVDEKYDRGEAHGLFKGDWYCKLFEDQFSRTGLRSAAVQKSGERLLSSLLSTINYRDDWARPFVDQTLAVITGMDGN